MHRFYLPEADLSSALKVAATALRDGGIVLYPTDTQYALGADALSDISVQRLYALKGRDHGKPINATVFDAGMAARYTRWTAEAQRLSDALLPGPLTLVLPRAHGCDSGIARDASTFAVRMPADGISRELARTFDGAVTATSANRSGLVPTRDVAGILAQLGDGTVDVVLDAGELPPRPPSTVIRLDGARAVLLRAGPIPFTTIEAMLLSR